MRFTATCYLLDMARLASTSCFPRKSSAHGANRFLGHYGLDDYLMNGKPREVFTEQTLVQKSYASLVLHECSNFRQVPGHREVAARDRVWASTCRAARRRSMGSRFDSTVVTRRQTLWALVKLKR